MRMGAERKSRRTCVADWRRSCGSAPSLKARPCPPPPPPTVRRQLGGRGESQLPHAQLPGGGYLVGGGKREQVPAAKDFAAEAPPAQHAYSVAAPGPTPQHLRAPFQKPRPTPPPTLRAVGPRRRRLGGRRGGASAECVGVHPHRVWHPDRTLHTVGHRRHGGGQAGGRASTRMRGVAESVWGPRAANCSLLARPRHCPRRWLWLLALLPLAVPDNASSPERTCVVIGCPLHWSGAIPLTPNTNAPWLRSAWCGCASGRPTPTPRPCRSLPRAQRGRSS